MFWPTRIKLLGTIGACLGNVIILGGFLLACQIDALRGIVPGREAVLHVFSMAAAEPRSAHATTRDARSASAVDVAPPTDFRVGSGRASHPFEATSLLARAPVATTGTSDPVSPPAAAVADSNADRAAMTAYQEQLNQIIARNSRYPAAARRQKLAGVTNLAFTLGRDGTLIESWIQDSSGSELLDDAALAALDRAQPLPPMPVGAPSRMDFVVQIDSSVLRSAARDAG